MRLRTRHGGDEILEREPKRRPRQNSRARGRSGTRLKVRTHTLHRRPCTCRKVASQRAVSPRTCKSTPTKEQVAHCQSSTNTSGSGGGGGGVGGGGPDTVLIPTQPDLLPTAPIGPIQQPTDDDVPGENCHTWQDLSVQHAVAQSSADFASRVKRAQALELV
jgi:hypothetical protein